MPDSFDSTEAVPLPARKKPTLNSIRSAATAEDHADNSNEARDLLAAFGLLGSDGGARKENSRSGPVEPNKNEKTGGRPRRNAAEKGRRHLRELIEEFPILYETTEKTARPKARR
jgi:hypothetical protein